MSHILIYALFQQFEIFQNKNRSDRLFKFLHSVLLQRDEYPLPYPSSQHEVANTFAKFFKIKLTKLKLNLTKKAPTNHHQEGTSNHKFHSSYSRSSIKGMNYTTCQTDPSNTSFLLKSLDIILGTLTKIINKSLTQAKFLQSWKTASVRPLLKGKELSTIPENFTPISNLSFVSKTVEKAIPPQILNHFESQNFMPMHQSAYRQNFSTEPALLNITHNILNNMESKRCTAMICLDLCVAFDTVNQSILLDILENFYGLQGSV